MFNAFATAQPTAQPDALDVFTARAEARAHLWREGDLDLHDAVDELQAAAEQTGFVESIGQDRVQAILATAFAAVRAHDDHVDDVPKRRGAAASTLMAAEYLVREGDADRLRVWLDAHSAEERAAIRDHLEAKRCR